MDRTEPTVRANLRTPRAAAVAGIVFSLLLGSALVLIRLSVPSGEASSAWLTDPGKRDAVELALGLIPFAGIAFLWFVGVIRDRIGDREDRFLATVFLGSGLLFVGMLFVAAAFAGGLLADPAVHAGAVANPALWDLERRITFTLLNTYAIRMGAVFILSTTTIGVRTGHPASVAHHRGVRGRDRAPVRSERHLVDEPRAARVGVHPQHRHPGQEQDGRTTDRRNSLSTASSVSIS